MVLTFSGRGILLDVEGTTSSVSYVYEILFPFARARMQSHLEANWNSPEVHVALDYVARDAGGIDFASWIGRGDRPAYADAIDKVMLELNRLMDADMKATGLKSLQGLIWRDGYNAGQLKSHVYEDVPLALSSWTESGLDVRIYSSGSVEAQKVFFANCEQGNLGRYLKGHYDTTTGAKGDTKSYEKIAQAMRLASNDILFISDVVAELDAAREAGMCTGLALRPGNLKVDRDNGHAGLQSFADIEIAPPSA